MIISTFLLSKITQGGLMIASCLISMMASLLSAAEPKEDLGKKDLEKLQGKWTVISVKENDRSHPEAKGAILTFKGDKLILGKDKEATIKFDSSKKPKEFELFANDGKKEISIGLGIYEFDGDTLKIAGDMDRTIRKGGPGVETTTETTKAKRPKSLNAKDATLIVLKRGEATVNSDDEKFKKLIVGKWKFQSGTPSFIGIHLTEFTADGKVRALDSEKGTWREVGTYSIKGEKIAVTVPNSFTDKTTGKLVRRDVNYNTPIETLTDTEFVTQYCRLIRTK